MKRGKIKPTDPLGDLKGSFYYGKTKKGEIEGGK